MNAAQLLVKCLENEDVRYIFGLAGEENMAVLDALLDSHITFIPVRHEQGAAFMADVYGRLSGRAGVCLSTLGPGATNLITGVADANLDRSPVVAITGQVGLERMHKGSHQYIDIVSTFKPFTKWNTLIHTPKIVAEVVRKAFKIAQTERPGACHLEFPEDVADMEAEGTPVPTYQTLPMIAPEELIRKAVKLIAGSRSPIILAGNGCAREAACDHLRQFAEKAYIPVAHTFMGMGAIPYSHPLSLHSVGLQSRDYINSGFEKADLVIAVGYDFAEYLPSKWNPKRDKTIIHVDTIPAEIDSHYTPAVELIGSLCTTLAGMTETVAPREGHTFAFQLRKAIEKELEEKREDSSFPLKPQKIVADMSRAMGKDDIVISDVGTHKLWIARMYPCEKPNTCVISNGFASMGIALPGAIAAKLLFPEKKIMAASGDGGFLMNVQELETAVELKVPIVNLVIRDDGFGLIKMKQIAKYRRSAFVEFKNPDLVALAESFGAKGYRVRSADELLPILNEAFRQSVPSVVDCPVDYSENAHLTNQLGKIDITV